eukprot:gnl/Chilomastix_caulleri/530.p2 GENE.gnl/Chilomastix_caulleri/530~~gnl/Chilomastix_caulleri/530.p2  ORF type:complete len:139 (+),score=16.21 gnl/Chilomastix_caulleri/530:293-709(+)
MAFRIWYRWTRKRGNEQIINAKELPVGIEGTTPYFSVARKNFAFNDKPNNWCEYDTGSAWMSLALQAHIMGLHAHGMAGFDEGQAYKVLRIDPTKFRVCSAIAVGYWDESAPKPPKDATQEGITTRNKTSTFIHQYHM